MAHGGLLVLIIFVAPALRLRRRHVSARPARRAASNQRDGGPCPAGRLDPCHLHRPGAEPSALGGEGHVRHVRRPPALLRRRPLESRHPPPGIRRGRRADPGDVLRKYVAAAIADSWRNEPTPSGDYPRFEDQAGVERERSSARCSFRSTPQSTNLTRPTISGDGSRRRCRARSTRRCAPGASCSRRRMTRSPGR